MKWQLIAVIGGTLATFIIPATAFAHVVVLPDSVGVSKFQTFTTSVPNEKEVAVTALRVVIPDGLKEVSPTVKPGWQIDTKKSSDGTAVTEIDWTGGSIPAEQRDDFTFSAQVPAQVTTLKWKAYQTYADGSIVSWDQEPKGSDDATGNKGPLSETKILNDVAPATVAASGDKAGSKSSQYVAGVAFIFSVVALTMTVQTRKKK